MRLLLLLPLLIACRVDLAGIGQPTAADPAPPAATPPPAPGPKGEKLYQMLYAGELGEPARAVGQRARMLAWMNAVGFTPEQLHGLITLARDVEADGARAESERAGIGDGEGQHLAPVYQEIVAAYAAGRSADDAALTPLAIRLQSARAEAYGGTDPRGAHYAQVSRTLEKVNRWAAALPSEQQDRIAECRFFLARRLGPFTNPGDYEKWLGTAWNGADFASLRASGRPVDEGQMDVGGLWAADADAKGQDGQLRGLRLAVLLLFAVQEPGFVPAVEVRLGERAPDDYAG